MAISLKNFVDVSLVHHQISSVNATRDTAALISTEDFTDSEGSYIFTSLTDFENRVTETVTTTKKFVTSFFNNGGSRLYIAKNISDAAANVKAAIQALPDEYIVVAFTGTQSYLTTVAAGLVTYDANNNVEYDVSSKIICMASSATDVNYSEYHRLAVKYVASTHESDVMTMAAYLTRVNVYGSDTVQDYNFTVENVDAENIVNDNTIFTTCISKDMNIDIKLSGATRNCGGNCSDGQELINEFMFIVLHQTLTEVILSALVNKLKGNIGLSVLKTVMSGELNYYVSNGYLATDKIWSDDTLTITYNGGTYVIIEKNTPLIKGYSITILPYTSLSPSDEAAHSTPPIVVIIATSYGIRKVVVRGEEF